MMSFLLPLGLLALLSLPLIVLLHFLRERLRRVGVPSLLLWNTLPRRVDGERNRKLPLTLLLLLHLLVAALLGLALSGPQIAGAMNPEARHTAIILDLSTSMAADDGGVTRFDRARDQARALLAETNPGDQILLITAGARSQIVASGADAARSAAILDTLRPGGVGMALDEALTLAEATLDPQLSRRVVVLTDGALPPLPARDVSVPLEWRQIGGDRGNRAIIAFATRSRGGRIQVYARLANYDAAPFNGQFQLYADGQPVTSRPETITIASRGETELTWTLPLGVSALEARILNAGDALPQDDAAYLSVARGRPIAALLVSNRPAALQRALAAIPGVTVTVIATDAYAAAPERAAADLTVFEGYLPEQWPAGATLVVTPPGGEQLLPAEATVQTLESGATLRPQGVALAGLEFGGVTFGSVRPVTPPEWAEVQLSSADLPLILRGRIDGREIAIWTFDIESSNLPTRLTFPLLMARTVRDLAPPPLPQAVRAGEPLAVRPDPRTTTLLLRGPDQSAVETPAAPVVLFDTLTEPGLYEVEEQRPAGPAFVGQVGVNAGAAIESNLAPQPAPPLRAPGTDPGGGSTRQMMDLWPWLALAALLILALEWAYVLRRTQSR